MISNSGAVRRSIVVPLTCSMICTMEARTTRWNILCGPILNIDKRLVCRIDTRSATSISSISFSTASESPGWSKSSILLASSCLSLSLSQRGDSCGQISRLTLGIRAKTYRQREYKAHSDDSQYAYEGQRESPCHRPFRE
jgi:hypothetical protein